MTRALSSPSKPRQKMLIVGLTGSIGMGKTTVAGMLRGMGIPVHDADEAVHKLIAKGGKAVGLLRKRFPQAYKDGAIDRIQLAALAKDRVVLLALEAILHPLVRKDKEQFLKACRKAKAPLVILDVPLLFETCAQKTMHQVIVVTAAASVQRARVMARPNMTAAKLRWVLARQCPDKTKRKLADFIIKTDCSLAETKRALHKVISDLETNSFAHLTPKSLKAKPCGKSSSIRKPRASTRSRATG